MKPIDMDGFEAKFAGDADPWSTWADRDEALKRRAILHALPAATGGRMLELGAGNGSNSQALAARTLRLDATEGTAEGTRLVARAIAPHAPRARALRLTVPEPWPRPVYDVIVIAELLYYLDARTMQALAAQVARHLRPGGTLMLAHHRITFYDFAQRAEGIHDRFVSETAIRWRECRPVRRTRRWLVQALKRT